MKNSILRSILFLVGVMVLASAAHAKGTGTCTTQGGYSILDCGSCEGEQYIETVPRSTSMPCPAGYTGSLTITWDEKWKHDVVCEPVGSGQCGQAHYCDPTHGWTRLAMPGPFTEEVQIDHATKIGEENHQLTDNCQLIVPSVGLFPHLGF